MDLEILGLSLWKLAMSLAISALLLMSKRKFPKVFAIAVLYPSIQWWKGVSLSEEEAHEVADIFYRGRSEVHLIFFNTPVLEH